VLISQWTFEVNTPPDLSNSATGPTTAADIGNGTATGVHANAATDWSTPVGNGSANSFSANTWAVDDYWQFQLSTVGYTSLQVGFDQTSSSTGPTAFKLAYSTDGSAFTDFQDYTVLVNGNVPNPSWTSGSTSAAYSYAFDLSAVTALDDLGSVYFRLVNRVAPTSAAGTDRVDNFAVSGTVKPAGTTPPTTVPDAGVGFGGTALTLVALLAAGSRRKVRAD
jgi:hypothetical protein